MIDSTANLSGPAFQTLAFYTAASGGYDVQYICESLAGAEINDRARRISRVRYLTGTNTLFDKYFAINNLTGNIGTSSYGKGTSEFIFPVIDEATVKGLTYGAL